MISEATVLDSFAEFVKDAEPRLRHALCAAFGHEEGREAAAHALAYGCEHWERVEPMENPVGYLWGVGRITGNVCNAPPFRTFNALSACQ